MLNPEPPKYAHDVTLTFANRRHLTEHGRRRGVIIYPNRLCNVAAHRSATKAKEASISILSRSMNRSLVMSTAWKCKFSGWRPLWPRKHKNLCISAHRYGTKTNEKSI